MGDFYVFTRFKDIELFGEIEAIADIQTFSTSLITATDCVFICFPTALYLQFLKNDGEILFKRTRNIIKSVFNEVKVNRVFLILSAMDRTITDSFCHANLELEYTRAGKLILEVEKDLQNTILGYRRVSYYYFTVFINDPLKISNSYCVVYRDIILFI